jgi:uncharacterized protein YbjT (DUF2867 family)
VAAAAHLEPGHDGTTHTHTGSELLSRADVARALSQELGRTITYLPVSDEQFRAAVKGVLSPSYTELMSHLYATVRGGQTAVKTGTVEELLGRPPITFAQFARDHRAAWA